MVEKFRRKRGSYSATFPLPASVRALILIHARFLLNQVLAQVELGSTIECSRGLPIVSVFKLGSALSLFVRLELASNSNGTS